MTHLNSNKKVAVLWRGDPREPDRPTHYETRLEPLIEALQAEGLSVEKIKYFDEDAQTVLRRLSACAGALVWINPLADGRDRTIVDEVLRDAAAKGVWIGAHPDTIAKMGTKEVLNRTRDLGWGSDTDLYASPAEFKARFPANLARGPRVLKPLKGNDGQGVLKVERLGDDLTAQHASDDRIEIMTLTALAEWARTHFELGGKVIDQVFNPNARAGMVRCYLCQDKVAGFAVQRPRIEDGKAFGMASAKAMHGPETAEFAALKAAMENDWVPGMREILDMKVKDLPVLWDADFLIRATPDATGNPYVLCEINVSCVSPFPDGAPTMLAKAARMRS